MKNITSVLMLAACLPGILSTGCSAEQTGKLVKPELYEGIEFEMSVVQEPDIPDFAVNITDFGAMGDGQVLNTEAFADAIAVVEERGGGQVIVPRGIWLTGPIYLKSNLDLHVEAGALVLFSKNKDLYPLVESSWEGWKTARCTSPIMGRNLENVAITGEGIFDGSGEVWRLVKRSKMTESQWKKIVGSGGIVSEDGELWYPSESFRKGRELRGEKGPWFSDDLADYQDTRDFYRPVLLSLINCSKVLLDGPVFQNSAAWCLHPLLCEDLTVRNVDVRNPWYSQNGDGIDIESCRNTVVHDCTFDVGDDAICIKSGKDQEGRDRGIPTENLVVKNCVVYHGHGGVTIGSEMSGGVRNMHVSGCTFIGTDVGLRFKSRRGRGGVVEKIYISDVDMIDIPTNAISFNLYYGGLSVSEMLEQMVSGELKQEMRPVSEDTPQFRDISMKNITCKGALQAIYLQGLPEMKLENIRMEKLTMESKKGLFCKDASGIHISDLSLSCEDSPALTIYNSGDVHIEGLQIPGSLEDQLAVLGNKSGQITVDGKPLD